MKTRKKLFRPGLSMIELMIAMIFISITILALIASSGAFTQANAFGIEMSTAEFLIEEIRELTTGLAVTDPQDGTVTFGAEMGENSISQYDDIDDFDGVSFSPPVDINGSALGNFSGYTQQITVENVDIGDLNNVVADHSTQFYKVTVTIVLNGQTLSTSSWIRTRI